MPPPLTQNRRPLVFAVKYRSGAPRWTNITNMCRHLYYYRSAVRHRLPTFDRGVPSLILR
ncbi:hypothetical protein CHELA40_12571 [Chelatococcus asaccharovorans]|nr:hypothetical protein CHELA40_12571 [Chelatococcus asaccharovorans]CAH1682284.1 hypothetical protein CHELA17_63043 [Chelatococcus asaccharovorans]